MDNDSEIENGMEEDIDSELEDAEVRLTFERKRKKFKIFFLASKSFSRRST